MDLTAISTLFEQGGWTLVFVVALGWVGRELYKRISAKFDELNNKVDELKEDVTALKVDNAKWTTAIRQCSHSDCPTKKLLEGDR